MDRNPNPAAPDSSVYSNKKWTQFRSSVGRTCQTGYDFRKLQSQMTAPRPSHLDSLPDHGLYELLTCVRCGHIPNPRDYMVCEENGHHLCHICAAAPTPNGGSQPGTKKYLKEKLVKLEPCCGYRNLKKGSPRLLETVLKSGMWRCQNELSGCTEVLRGLELEEHLLVCKYRSGNRDQDQDSRKLPCYYQGCASTKDHHLAKHLVKHYKEKHGASVTEGRVVGLEVDYTEMVEKRHISLIKLPETDSYLAFACEFCRTTEVLHMWVWNMKSDPDTSSRTARGNKANNVEEVIYNLKLAQVRECEEVGTSDLTFDAACLPHILRPREIIETEGPTHFRIGMEAFFNSCVEDTPNGNGRWSATLRFDIKKDEYCD